MLFDAGAARSVRAALLEQAFHRRRRLLIRGCATKPSRPSAAGQHARRRRRLVRPRRRDGLGVWQPHGLGVWWSQWMAARQFHEAAHVCETMFADCHRSPQQKRSAVLRPRPASAVRSILDSIVVSIPACHAGGRGSIPRQGASWQRRRRTQTRRLAFFLPFLGRGPCSGPRAFVFVRGSCFWVCELRGTCLGARAGFGCRRSGDTGPLGGLVLARGSASRPPRDTQPGNSRNILRYW